MGTNGWLLALSPSRLILDVKSIFLLALLRCGWSAQHFAFVSCWVGGVVLVINLVEHVSLFSLRLVFWNCADVHGYDNGCHSLLFYFGRSRRGFFCPCDSQRTANSELGVEKK